MSDIRYNSWLHRSGTGGVYQDSSGRIGIGTSVPAGTGLHVKEGYSGLSAPNAHADTLYLENSGNAGVTIATPNTNTGYLTFADPDDDNIGQIIYRHNGNSMGFFVNAAERLRIDTDGRVMVGNTAAASMFTVANNLVVGSGSGSEGMTIYSDSTNDGYICFADGQSDPAYRMGQIIYSHQSNKLQFRTNGNTDRLTVDNAGNTNISGVCTATTFSPSEGQLGHRNYIINGSMYYWQRGTSGTNMSANAYLCDRFKAMSSTDGEGAISRETDVPTASQAGTRFVYSLKVDVTTADTSLAAGQYIIITQRIEGRQMLDLGFGLAGTRYATLSFWVKAPAGTYGVSFRNGSYNRSYVVEYTVNSANTWEKKTITIPVDTSGTWAHDNTLGLDIQWSLGVGSNFQGSAGSWSGNNYHSTSNQYNLYSSTSNNFFLTGVQFERGSTSTPFEWRGEAEEKRRVQRYYWGFHAPGTQIGLCNAMARTSDMFMSILEHPVQMRASPSLVTSTTAGHHEVVWKNSQGDCNNSGITTPGGTYLRDFSYPIAGTLNSGSFGSDALFVQLNGAGTVAFQAEL